MGNSSSKSPYYSKDESPESKWPDWMTNIRDNAYITELSIPGTHNTWTFEGYGGSLTQCQSWSLYEQLEAGVKFLDIRCRHYQDGLPIHHGIVYQNANFHDVLKECIRFLDKYFRDAIIMRVREEHTEEGCTRSFNDTFKEILAEYDEKYFWVINKIPKLEEVRGKIVILQDFGGPPMGIWYHALDIADQWDVPSTSDSDINDKWANVETHLLKARDGPRETFYLTYTSGSSVLAHPDAVAECINPKTYDFLTKQPEKHRWGMIAIDFPGTDLVRNIIKSNFD